MQEVNRAKAQMKAGILMSLENTTSRMEQLGRQQMIFGRHSAARRNVIEKIDEVWMREADNKMCGPHTQWRQAKSRSDWSTW